MKTKAVFPFMSSHPAEKAITLQFVVKNLNFSARLEGAVLDAVISFGRTAIQNYQPWILQCFEIMTDRDYRCRICDLNVTYNPDIPDESVIDAARNHIFTSHPEYFKTRRKKGLVAFLRKKAHAANGRAR